MVIAANRGWYLFHIFFNVLQKVVMEFIPSQSGEPLDSRVNPIFFYFF